LGLVDELGGYRKALQVVREAAQLPPDAELRLRVYPRPKSTWEYLLEHGIVRSSDSAVASAFVQTMRKVEPIVALARRLGLIPSNGVLTMPEMAPFQ
jgi:protease-4